MLSNNLQSKRTCLTPPKPDSKCIDSKAAVKVVDTPPKDAADAAETSTLPLTADSKEGKLVEDAKELQLTESTSMTEQAKQASLQDDDQKKAESQEAGQVINE